MATVTLNLTAASGGNTSWNVDPIGVITTAWGLRGVLSGVPVASRITSAVLSAPASQVGGYAQYPNEQIRVHGYDVNAAGAVTEWPAIASITRTNASVLGTPTSSIDVTTVVQAIVNRGGWTGPIGLLLYRPDYSNWQAPTPTGITLTISYEGPPTLTATAAQTGPRTLTIAPTLDAGDTLDHYTVDWGDSATDNLLTHTYATSGSKSWTVTATLSRGRTLTTSGTTSVDNYPQATLTLAVTVGRTVAATLATTLASGTTLAEVTYDWGDSSGQTASSTHTYDLPGTYTVTAHVTDSRGSKTTATAQITVSFATVAVLAATPYGLTVTLDGTQARAATGSSITSWQWDHGDGTSSGGAISKHTYTAEGTYRVVLTVTDSNQLTARAVALVTVSRWVDATTDDPARQQAMSAQTRDVDILVELLSPDRHTVIPWHERCPVHIGDVTVDGTTLARWSSSMEITDPAWLPRHPRDPLHHLARTWIRVWHLVALDATSWLRTPIGTYRIGVPHLNDEGGVITATCDLYDPITLVRRALWGPVGLSLSGMDASEAIASILADRAPWLPVDWTPAGSMLPDGYQVGTPEGDPIADIEAIALAHQIDVHTDAMGVVQVNPLRAAGHTATRWVHGPGCEVTAWTVETDPADLCNEATVWSTADGVAPVSATVRDTDTASPLYIGHGVRYGRAEGLAEVTTEAQCRALARQMVDDGKAARSGVTVQTRANPSLMPGDLAAVVHPGIGLAGVRTIRKWTLTVADVHADTMTVDAVDRI